ncbi:MAG: anaerobic ribonucleoside-triphosphate reductase, partial [Aeromonas veronii]
MIKVTKRDGTSVPFQPTKIVKAVMKAQEAVDASNITLAQDIADDIQRRMTDTGRAVISVSELHTLVEKMLLSHNHKASWAYTEYRKSRDVAREKDSQFVKDIRALITQEDKLIANENANKDSKVFPVQRDLMAGIISKHFGKNYALPPHIVQAHDSGDIHYHDLDYAPFLPMTNCCLVDLKGLLANGFRLGNAQIESPKSIGVACAVMAQITAQVASHQYGGTTFANIDQILEPYVEASWIKHFNVGVDESVADLEGYADRRTAKEVFDGIQAYEYEINTLFTTNGQTPFVTVTFGM